MKPILLFGLLLLLAACAPQGDPGDAVEAYLQALVNKEFERAPSLSCPAWERDARIEFDSFGALTARLENANCTQSGTSNDYTLVTCQGQLIYEYNNETQTQELSRDVYRAVQVDGEWRMCGYE